MVFSYISLNLLLQQKNTHLQFFVDFNKEFLGIIFACFYFAYVCLFCFLIFLPLLLVLNKYHTLFSP